MKTFFFPLLISLILIFHSHLIKEIDTEPSGIETNFTDTTRIRFDGIYNTLDTSILLSGKKASEHYTSNCLAVFTKNNQAIRIIGATVDNSFKECAFYKKIKKEQIGEYYVKGDSIYACIPTTFVLPGMRYRLYRAFFRGFIKNKDTIINWQMMPPYPVKLSKFVRERNTWLLEPQSLYFIKVEAVHCLEDKE